LLSRKANIRKLAMQLEDIKQQLQCIENDKAYLPDPMEMKTLSWMRYELPRLADYTNALDKKLWERINEWKNTPYTKAELRKDRVVEFLELWFAASATILTTVIGWFVSAFPAPWYAIPTSVIIGFVIAFCVIEKK